MDPRKEPGGGTGKDGRRVGSLGGNMGGLSLPVLQAPVGGLVSKAFRDLTGLTLGFYFLEVLFVLALLIDEEGGSMHAQVGSSHELLLSPNPIRLRDRVICVGQKRERELVFGHELLVRRFLVG